jgi:hypothetical protein
MRQIVITPVLNGFKVQVGCQEVVFTSIDCLCGELKRYQKDSQAIEKEYLANALNKLIGPPVAVPETLTRPPGENERPGLERVRSRANRDPGAGEGPGIRETVGQGEEKSL